MSVLIRKGILRISQIVICSGIKHVRSMFAFTEQGVAMILSAINSARGIAHSN